jgi:CheY-like chemotaxis protein
MSQLLLTTHGSAAEATALARTKSAPPLVMIVDDHADTREMLRYVIELSGCLVVGASDGEEAVRLAKRKLPDLILMDTSLPELDGYSATERIRNLERDRKVTIIFLSGHAGPQARDKAFAAGGDDYFLKPIDLEKLELALTKYLMVPASSAS